MKTITLDIPDELEEKKAKLLIAGALYDKAILTSSQAAELAGMSRKEFLIELGTIGITIFGETEEDLKKIR
ncbi:MAG: UPF0175 family protein [Chloroherpetonaceae bacterium]|nr:UPF0175 family protein [Chloroherpetonaceae bacterium]